MNGVGQKIVSQVTKSARQNAIDIAKKVAKGNLEVIRDVQTQVTGIESAALPPSSPEAKQPESAPDHTQALEAKINSDSKRLLDSLENELKMIRQKKAQAEMYAKQQAEATVPPVRRDAPVAQGKLRRAIGGMKAKLKQMTSKTEKQKSVSG